MTPAAQVIDLMVALKESLAQPEPRVVPPPAPGLYPNIPHDEYLRWDAASSSRLNALDRTPAHLKAEIDDPSDATDDQDFGTAIHCAILEPDSFNTRYACGPDGNWALKANKDAVAALREQGFHVLKPEQYNGCLAIRDNVRSHAAAALALQGSQELRELSGVWMYRGTDDIACKLRADHLNPALGAVVDVKSTPDASETEFQRSIYIFKYYRQAAFYNEGMRQLMPDVDWQHHIIIAVEKKRPWAVNVFRIRDDAMETGRDELFGRELYDERFKGGLMAKYIECVRTNTWPAYPEIFHEISLPPWAWAQIDAKAGVQ